MLFLLVAAPGLILYLYFTLTRPSENHVTELPDFNTTLTSLIQLKSFITHSIDQVGSFLYTSYVLFATALAAIVMFIVKRKRLAQNEKRNFIFWGCCWFLLTVILFITPDGFGGGSVMTLRLLEISVLLFITWIASGVLPVRIYFLLGGFMLTIGLLQIHHRKETLQGLNKYMNTIESFGPHVQPGHTAAYIPLGNTWLELHAGDVLFAEKRCVLLTDYEAYHDYFQVQWNDSMPYNYKIGGATCRQVLCINAFWPEYTEKPSKNIDYILLSNTWVSPGDSACYKMLSDSLNAHYDLLEQKERLSLYRSKEFVDKAR
jgi:hypothetical protein